MTVGRLPVEDHCQSCGAGVAWARTPKGEGLMVDLDPRADGNLELIVDHLRRRWASVTRRATSTTTVRYVAHFASCPHAKEHRRPRPKPPAQQSLF